MLADAFAADAVTTGWLAARPWSVGAVAMALVGRNSYRTGRHRLHVAAAATTVGAALALGGLFAPDAPRR